MTSPNRSPVFFYKNQLKEDIMAFKKDISFIQAEDSKKQWEEARRIKQEKMHEEKQRIAELYERGVFSSIYY